MRLLIAMTFAFFAIAQIPDTFDAREQWPTCFKTVRNMNNCVCSWAHAFAGMIGDRFCINHLHEDISISAQSLLSCVNTTTDCSGKFNETELKKYVVKDNAFFSEKQFPYDGTQKDCPSLTGFKCTSLNTLETSDQIKTEIMTNGPVVCIVDQYKDFLDYYSGIYYPTFRSSAGIRQALKIIGWGVENSIKYWTVETAQGPDFGENGYTRFYLDGDLCKEAYACVVAT